MLAANKNTNVCNKTIKPPVAPFMKKLKYAPIKLVIEPTRILIKINLGNLSVSKYAVAPGVITIAMTRKAPTVWRAATHEADNILIALLKSLLLGPVLLACQLLCI